MKLSRACVVLMCVALPALCASVAAQTFPTKPVRWVIPFPPGGGTDTISRTLAQKLTEIWGHQVIADNRPGSGGTIGMAIAAKLPPDGYNLVLGQLANVAIAPALYPKLQYRSRERLHADQSRAEVAAHPRRASFGSREEREGADRARAREARFDHVRFARQRHHRPSRHRAHQERRQSEDDAHPVQRRGSGVHRSSRRRDRGVHEQHSAGDSDDEGRARSRARRERRGAHPHAARRADDRRERTSRLRGHELVRRHGAGGRTEGPSRHAFMATW